MEGWLILLGVALPLAPMLQVIEERLSAPAPRRAAVRIEPPAQRRDGVS